MPPKSLKTKEELNSDLAVALDSALAKIDSAAIAIRKTAKIVRAINKPEAPKP